MPTQHVRTYDFAFPLNKQSAMATATVDGSIIYKRSVRTFAPVEGKFKSISDKDWFGKGHPFSTFYDTVTKMFTLPSRETSMTELDALFAIAFGMGSVSTTGAGPEYTHTLKFVDLTTQKEVRYFSCLEKMGSEYQKKATGAWINSFRIHGKMDDHVLLSWEGGARNYITSAATMPASISTASFFKTLFGTMTFGPFSNETTTICTEVLDFQIECSQNAEPKYYLCNPATEETLISEVLIGKQSMKFTCRIKIDAAIRANFLAQDLVGVTIVMRSEDIITGGSNHHTLTCYIPSCKISDESFGEDGETVAYTLTMDENSIIKTGTAEPIRFTLLTGISGTAILVNA